MAKTFEIPTELRTDMGKGASRRLRRAGKVPAILYGGGRAPVALTLEHHTVFHATEDERFYTSLLELKAGRTRQTVILRDLQRHPYRSEIMHVDFQRIDEKSELQMKVPLHFIGEADSPAGRTSGIVITHQRADLDVICLPGNLPEFIDVDLSTMEEGDMVHIGDIQLPEGVRLASDVDNDQPVASTGHVVQEVVEVEEEIEGEAAEEEGEVPAEDGGESEE